MPLRVGGEDALFPRRGAILVVVAVLPLAEDQLGLRILDRRGRRPLPERDSARQGRQILAREERRDVVRREANAGDEPGADAVDPVAGAEEARRLAAN